MCTLVAACGLWPHTPLVVAANRDELLDRPSAPPGPYEAGNRRAFAPRDLRAGGSWIGVNEVGLFVGITNRYLARRPGETRSRGLLVRDALACGSAREAADLAGAVAPADYDGFHLLLADAEGAWLVHHDLEQVRRRRLEPGVHVVTERSLGADPTGGRGLAVARAAEALCAAGVPDEPALAALLARHAGEGEDPFSAPCVHVELPGLGSYGTRSSTLLWLETTGPRWHHANGPPCRTGYRDLTGEVGRVLEATPPPRP